MKLIVGLGNPGKEYENTRHNVGFRAVEYFKESVTTDAYKTKFNGQYVMLKDNNETIILLKPLSYMNLSGNVVKKYVDYYNIPLENVLVIYDDMDFDLGKIKIKKSGSAGGHNGINNIIQLLNTESIKRIRIGISKSKVEKKDYVLGKFNSQESEIINQVIKKTKIILDDYLDIDFEKLMSKYN